MFRLRAIDGGRFRAPGDRRSELELLRELAFYAYADYKLKTLNPDFLVRTFTISSTPVKIIASVREPRGYILINQTPLLAVASTPTIFASALRTPATYTSSTISVGNVRSVRFFLDLTVNAGGGDLQIHVDTQDPLSLNWNNVAPSIFGVSSVNTFYHILDGRGIDISLRVRAVVSTANMTFSLSAVLKDGLSGAAVGDDGVIFFGGSAVSSNHFPLMPSQRIELLPEENTEVWARTNTGTATLKIMEL